MKKKELGLFILTFSIPVVIMCIVYSVMGLYPFGTNSVLSLDLWGQYYPMIKALWYDMHDLAFDRFSWDGGLGFNLYAQALYYTNSIFYRLLYFFDENHLIEGLDVLLMIKFGLCSASFLGFIKYKYKNINLSAVAVSVGYGLCSYSLAYINQPMWTDCIWLLPLVMIGLERLVHQKKPLIYTLLLAFTIYTNFYIAFSMCIFILLCFIVMSVDLYNNKTELLGAVKRFLFYSVIAGGLSAFSTLPMLAALGDRVPVDTVFGGIKAYHSLAEMFGSMFMFTNLSYEFFVPNIYSGVFAIPFIGLYIGNNGIDIKKRTAVVLMTAVLLCSLNINLLDFIWHGFHFPNQLPGRWSFMLSFFVLTYVYEGINSQKKADFFQPLIMLLLFILLFAIGLGSDAPDTDLHLKNTVTLCFAAVYIVLTLLLFALSYQPEAGKRKGKKHRKNKVSPNDKTKKTIDFAKKGIMIVISVIIIAETGVNSVYCAKNSLRVSEIAQYFFNDSMNGIRENVLDNDKDFYRVEMNPGYTFNPGLLFDYRGISYYSSTMNGRIYNLMKAIGNRVYAKNVSSVYNTANLFTNSLFSVKYIIDRNKTMPMYGYEIIDENDNYRLLLNRDSLPVAFPVNKEMHHWLEQKDLSPLEQLNDFLYKALGSKYDVFVKINPKKTEVNNAELETKGEWMERHYIRTDKSKGVSFSYSFVCDNSGPYFAIHNFVAGDVIINAGGTEYKINKSSPIKYIGELKKGDVVTMDISTDNLNYALYGLELYRFDPKTFHSAVERLKTGGFETTDFSSDTLEGTIKSEKDNQLFFTSIPYEKGWDLYCDGEKIKIQKIADSLIAFTVPSGSHTIKFVHHTPALLPGAVISILFLCILAILHIKRHRNEKIEV